MRRSDLELTTIEDLLGIIAQCDVCRLGLYDGQMPYIVPMNFGYTYENGQLLIYLHGAKKGRKMSILENYPKVCFEMDLSLQLLEGPRPCDYTLLYKSIMGEGLVERVEDYGQKVYALEQIMRKYAPDKTFDFTPARVNAIEVLVLKVESMTGKASKPKPIHQINQA